MFSLTRTSALTGQENSMDIPMSISEFTKASNNWNSGVLIQDAFPTLSEDIREFIMSGITPSEWEDLLPTIEELDTEG
jgi:hypothetical protein